MMSEASFAPLGPTSRTRKGGATPTMRPPLTPLPDSMADIAALADEQLEAWGWSDLISEEGESGPAISAKQAPAGLNLQISPMEDEQALAEHHRGHPHAILDPLSSANILSIGQHPGVIGQHPGVVALASEGPVTSARSVVLHHQKRLAQRVPDKAAARQGASAQPLVAEALGAQLDDTEDLEALGECVTRR